MGDGVKVAEKGSCRRKTDEKAKMERRRAGEWE